MMFGDTNSGRIVEVNRRRLVAEVYKDAWDDNIVRVQFEERRNREMDVFGLQTLIEREGWEEETYGNSGNTSLRLYETWNERECSSCHSEPLYDSSEDEWYCPRCE